MKNALRLDQLEKTNIHEPKLKYTNLIYSNLISISLVTLKKLHDIFKFENRNDIPPCNTVGPVEL